MSWDKNTISISELDTTIKVLDNLSIHYEVSLIGSFQGRGLNDPADITYDLRCLRYGDFVLLEAVELDRDCDTDDTIFSEQFKQGEEPIDWQTVRLTDKNNQYGGGKNETSEVC